VIKHSSEVTKRSGRRGNPKKLATYAFFLLALAAAAWAIASRGSQLTKAVQHLSILALVGSFAAGLLGILALYASWLAAVTDGQVDLPFREGLRIYGVGQIGKYLPGSVWPVLTQAQLGRRLGISPLRMASGALLALAVSVSGGLVLGCVLLPLSGDNAARTLWWAPLVAVPLVLVLAPPILNRLIALSARILRRGAVEPAYTLAGIARCAGWATLGNFFFGLHIFCLGYSLGATSFRGYLLGVCAYALASSIGVIVIFAPAGAGIRETVLIAVLAPVLSVDSALAIALVSRVVLILVDVLVAVSQMRGLNGSQPDRKPSVAAP
jgi:glycosyltransferase 2 family protein